MDYSKAEAKLAARERFTGLWAAIKIVSDVADGLWSVDTRYDQQQIVVGESASEALPQRRRVQPIPAHQR